MKAASAEMIEEKLQNNICARVRARVCGEMENIKIICSLWKGFPLLKNILPLLTDGCSGLNLLSIGVNVSGTKMTVRDPTVTLGRHTFF